MRKIIFIGLVMSMVSCVNTKHVSLNKEHFALQEHTFDELCNYFDSSYTVSHPELKITER